METKASAAPQKPMVRIDRDVYEKLAVSARGNDRSIAREINRILRANV